MKINVTQVLLDFAGEPMETAALICPECGQALKAEPMTVRKMICDALGRQLRSEQNLDGEVKLKRFKLGMKMIDLDELELSSEEIVMILDQAARMFTPIVYGRLVQVLDPVRLQDA